MKSAWKLLRLVTVALLFGAVAQTTMAQSGQLQKVKVRMDWVPNGIYGAFYYGQKGGFYAKEGLDVEVLPGQGSNATMDGLLRNDIDFGFASCWAMAIGIGQGREVVSIATFTGRNGFSFFYPKEFGNIQLKDLKGKTMVVSPAGLHMLLYPYVLAINGITENDIKKVSVDSSQALPTYIRGQADFVTGHIASSSAQLNKSRASNAILWADAGFVMPDFCVITSKEKLAKDPKLAERFLKATYAAAREGATKTAEVAAAAVALQPLLDKNNAEQEWKQMSSMFYSENTKGCPHGWHSKADWTQGLEILKKAADMKGDISDHSKFYTNQFYKCDKT